MVNVRKQDFVKCVQLLDKDFASRKDAEDYILTDARAAVQSLGDDWFNACHVEYLVQVPDENLIMYQVALNRKQEKGVFWKRYFSRERGFIKF